MNTIEETIARRVHIGGNTCHNKTVLSLYYKRTVDTIRLRVDVILDICIY